jgi:hypothetical protein
MSLSLALGFCGPSSVAFTPAALPSVRMWLRSDLGVTGSSKASGWADQTGNGNNASQGTSSAQPTITTGVRGLQALEFSTNVAMALPSFAVAGAKSIAIIFQCTSDPSTSTFQSLLTLLTATGGLFSELILANITGYKPYTFAADFTTITALGSAAALDTNTHGILVTYNGGTNTSAASYSALLDNATQGVAASSTDARTSTDSASVGGRIGTGNVCSNGLIGLLYEVIVTGDGFTPADEANLHMYFNARYGSGIG